MADGLPSLWALADGGERRAAASPGRRQPSVQWILRAVPVLVLATGLGLALAVPADLAREARVALFAFGLAVIFWSFTPVNAAYVALGAVLVAVLGSAVEQDELFEALAADVIWLMIGAFFLGAAVLQTGLADRMTRAVAARARDVNQMFWLVTLMLLPLTFLIPSTSGRAAVALPVFRSLTEAAADPKVSRALALLIPTVILVSTIASLVGAGSHLVAVDLLDETSDDTIGFLEWMLYGAPFGVAAAFVSAFVVMRQFLTRAERRRPLRPFEDEGPRPFSRAETITLAVVVGMVGLWSSEAVHGFEVATVAVLGAFVLTLPGLGVLTWKAGLQAVSWNLVVFVGAALVLGEALIETGAAEWLIGGIFRLSGVGDGGSVFLVLVAVTLITLTSHIYLTSHTARAAALVPPLLYLALSLQLSPKAMMFIGTVGMNYCLTFPVSSKALLMFGDLGDDTWRPSDLLKLSAVLLPVHAVLMVAFYYGWWRHVGLSLGTAS